MSPKNQNKIPSLDKFGILSAAWILACNDTNPIMTYKSIQKRLLLEEYNIDAIKSIINSRGELFRKRVPNSYLKRWKEQMREGQHLPTWITEEKDKSKHLEIIDKLGQEDTFISQFRSDDNDPAWVEGSPIEIIDWGLQHIERLRKTFFELRDEALKKWQLWILLFFSFTSFILSIINLFR